MWNLFGFPLLQKSVGTCCRWDVLKRCALAPTPQWRAVRTNIREESWADPNCSRHQRSFLGTPPALPTWCQVLRRRVRVASRQGMLRINYACISSLLFPTCAQTRSKWAKGSMWELLLDTTVVSEYVLLQVRVLVLCPRRLGHMKMILGLQALQGLSLIACRA